MVRTKEQYMKDLGRMKPNLYHNGEEIMPEPEPTPITEQPSIPEEIRDKYLEPPWANTAEIRQIRVNAKEELGSGAIAVVHPGELEIIDGSEHQVAVKVRHHMVSPDYKRRFESEVDWTDEIKLPPEPTYHARMVSRNDIINTLKYFEESECYTRVKALIMLGSASGLRAEELYQLTPKDINIDSRIVHINHNPSNGQSTKTKVSRVSFFDYQTKQVLGDYKQIFNSSNNLHKLFAQGRMERLFRNAPIKVKDLRKHFSQEWDRRGGPTSIKKILMGHSIKGDVDLMHYNAQSEEDLKKIYDRVMNIKT